MASDLGDVGAPKEGGGAPDGFGRRRIGGKAAGGQIAQGRLVEVFVAGGFPRKNVEGEDVQGQAVRGNRQKEGGGGISLVRVEAKERLDGGVRGRLFQAAVQVQGGRQPGGAFFRGGRSAGV